MAKPLFDNASTLEATASATHTVPHVCTGDDLAVYVLIGISFGGSVSGVAYAGDALTPVDSWPSEGVNNWWLYRLAGAQAGSNDVVVTLGGSASALIHVISLTGVDAADPDGAIAEAAALSVALTGVTSDQLVLTFVFSDDNEQAGSYSFTSVGTDQTERTDSHRRRAYASGATQTAEGSVTSEFSEVGGAGEVLRTIALPVNGITAAGGDQVNPDTATAPMEALDPSVSTGAATMEPDVASAPMQALDPGITPPDAPAGLFYTDFSGYTTGARPQDWRRHRSPVGFHDWDQVVEDDALATGGKKLAYEAGDSASHVLSADFVPVTEYQDIVVRVTAGGPVDGGIGGVVVGSTSYWNETETRRHIGEFGARIYRDAGAWLMQLWRYDDAPLLAHDNATVSIDSWFAPGTWARIRLRRDPTDTDGGANPLGTVRAKVWEDGTAEPGAWDLSFAITAGTPEGPCGIYGNQSGGGAEYDWVGISTVQGTAAPEAEDGYASRDPDPVSDPDLSAHTVEQFDTGTIGQAPAGWSPYYQTDATFTEEAEVDAGDGRVLKAQRTGANFRNFFRRDEAISANQEVLARAIYRTPETGTFRGGIAVRLNSGDDAFGIHVTTAGQVGRFDYQDGSVTTATHDLHRTPIDDADWFWIRLQADGDIFRGKAWQDDELEPTFWAFELEDAAAAISDGGVGVAIIDTPEIDYDLVAVLDLDAAAGATVTPDVASAILAALDPTTAAGAVAVGPDVSLADPVGLDPTSTPGAAGTTPDTASAILTALDATVATGPVTASPEVAAAIMAALDVSVGAATQQVSPEVADALMAALDVANAPGSVTLAPDVATAIIIALDPAIGAETLVVAPDTAGALMEALDVTALPGARVVTPDVAQALLEGVAVSLATGATGVEPPAALAIMVALDRVNLVAIIQLPPHVANAIIGNHVADAEVGVHVADANLRG